MKREGGGEGRQKGGGRTEGRDGPEKGSPSGAMELKAQPDRGRTSTANHRERRLRTRTAPAHRLGTRPLAGRRLEEEEVGHGGAGKEGAGLCRCSQRLDTLSWG